MSGRPIVCLTIAAARGGVIGDAGRVPWRLPDDMKRFKALTMGKPIILGRTTFERDIKRALPGRLNIVLTRSETWSSEGVRRAGSIEEGLALAAAEAALTGAEEVHIIGGAEVYRAGEPFADRIYLTRIEADISGDTRWHLSRPEEWCEVSCEPHPKDDRHAYAFSFVTLERRG